MPLNRPLEREGERERRERERGGFGKEERGIFFTASVDIKSRRRRRSRPRAVSGQFKECRRRRFFVSLLSSPLARALCVVAMSVHFLQIYPPFKKEEEGEKGQQRHVFGFNRAALQASLAPTTTTTTITTTLHTSFYCYRVLLAISGSKILALLLLQREAITHTLGVLRTYATSRGGPVFPGLGGEKLPPN